MAIDILWRLVPSTPEEDGSREGFTIRPGYATVMKAVTAAKMILTSSPKIGLSMSHGTTP